MPEFDKMLPLDGFDGGLGVDNGGLHLLQVGHYFRTLGGDLLCLLFNQFPSIFFY